MVCQIKSGRTILTDNQCKKLECKSCKHYCEPRDKFPLGTCLAAPSYIHGLDKMESCPKHDEYYEDETR